MPLFFTRQAVRSTMLTVLERRQRVSWGGNHLVSGSDRTAAVRAHNLSLAGKAVHLFFLLLCVHVATVQAQAPIRVGVSVGVSGQYAALGQNQVRGHQLCVKDANAAGGVLGRKIELSVEDDKSQPKEA